MKFPDNDTQFEEQTITKAEMQKDGWVITGDGGGSLYVTDEMPVAPKEGMTARYYGKGLGYTIRGFFIDGHKVYYRTEEEDEERHDILMYGADAADLLSKWDAGEVVHTIEMGGLGPGYEQTIHIACFEILRLLVDEKPDASLWENDDIWSQWRDKLWGLESLKELGLSGAQAGAATSLATSFYRTGPRDVLKKTESDRRIMVSRAFPQAPAAVGKS